MSSSSDTAPDASQSSTPSSSTDGNPQPRRVFRFLKPNGDKKGTMNIDFKKPEITGGKKKYVEYYFRIPEALREQHGNKTWKRFKVYEDINRIKSDEYAEQLRYAVEIALIERRFNPFEDDIKFLEKGRVEKKIWTIQQAILFFKTKWQDRGLAKKSLEKINCTSDRFLTWFTAVNLQHKPAEEITLKQIEAYLSFAKQRNKWSNRTYNNERSNLSTMYRFFVKQGFVKQNLIADTDKQKTKPTKHRYFDSVLLPKVKAKLAEKDPIVLWACELVYGLCVRSEMELRSLQVKDIHLERDQIFLRQSKTQERFMHISPDLKQKITARGIMNYPPEYYVLGIKGTPAAKPYGAGFIAKRFALVRKELGLSNDYTVYGFKHTRVVHMKLDGLSDAEIMVVTGHTDILSMSKYLRDLGVDVNHRNIAEKSRAF